MLKHRTLNQDLKANKYDIAIKVGSSFKIQWETLNFSKKMKRELLWDNNVKTQTM